MKTKNEMFEKAENAKRESKSAEFKERFDVEASQDWCEIIKDIVAVANSGGGVILFGLKNNGTPSGFDVTPILNIDPAQLTDKIAKYTDEQFSGFEIEEINKYGKRIAALLIHGVFIPMVFIKPGTYDIGSGKQRTAFARGTVYFRHGAKSEPARTNDLKKAIEKEIERTRKSWLGNIRRIVEAPLGSTVQVLPPEIKESTNLDATPIRIVDDIDAPTYQIINSDNTYPYRQKELLIHVNERLNGGKTINSFDILSVRRVYKIDETEPRFYYKAKYTASPQYSNAFADWLVKQYEDNPLFFDDARREYKAISLKRREE
jgi:hypothetical protein